MDDRGRCRDSQPIRCQRLASGRPTAGAGPSTGGARAHRFTSGVHGRHTVWPTISDAVDACILAAQARLGIVEEPGRVLVGGTPYDQAVLLSALDPVGAGLLRRHFERLDEETPGMYRLPLQVLSVSTDSGVH